MSKKDIKKINKVNGGHLPIKPFNLKAMDTTQTICTITTRRIPKIWMAKDLIKHIDQLIKNKINNKFKINK
jgi:hypothetical protein